MHVHARMRYNSIGFMPPHIYFLNKSHQVSAQHFGITTLLCRRHLKSAIVLHTDVFRIALLKA